jgi:putative transcriptional regulator
MKRKKQPSIGAQIIQGLKEFVEDLENGVNIEKKYNCRRVVVNPETTEYSPERVRETRRLLRASQTVFARFLGVSPQTVRAWEQGTNVPSDLASRFMDEIHHNPDYWRRRLKDLAVAR